MKKITLLFSPGLDSFLGEWICKKIHYSDDETIKKVYIDINSRYSQFEINFLTKWYKDIEIIQGPDLSSIETQSAFIPNRNAILASVAQAYNDSDVILFNATFDDRVSDGSSEFRSSLSEVLTISNKKNIIVESLLKNKEKSQHIKDYINENPESRLDLLNKTYSCYNSALYECCDVPHFKYDDEKDSFLEEGKTIIYGCMECAACYRRLCALTAANIFVPFYDNSLAESYLNNGVDKETYPNRFQTMIKYNEFLKKI